MNITEGDVFDFDYSDAFFEDKRKWGHPSEPWYYRHCFDGQLVAVVVGGDILLRDTYWAFWDKEKCCFVFSGDSGRAFSAEEAARNGALKLRFNLADVEATHNEVADHYDAADWFDISYQHGCYKRFVLKKGAKKSQSRMLQAIDKKIAQARLDMEAVTYRIERLEEQRKQIAQPEEVTA